MANTPRPPVWQRWIGAKREPWGGWITSGVAGARG